MKRTLLMIIALSAALTLSAQTTVKGVVLDSLTRTGEPAAILQFFKAGSPEQPVAYTTTSEDGTFSKDLEGIGMYELLFNNMGRKPRTVAFRLDGQGILDLGEILIEDDIQTLKAGSVTAQKILVKMDVDKITYKVADDVDSKTSTVLEMLRKVPMVSVDGQDNITVNGSSSFLVYVDGKPNPMISANPSQILKLMPASAVKDIEVITNPGARYDAEGVGGVLNLITGVSSEESRALFDGQYGNVTLQGSTKGFGGGLYYSMQKGKWALSLSGNASNTYINAAEYESKRIQKTSAGDFVTSMAGASDVRTPFYNASVNLSYEIDSRNLITVGAGYVGNAISTESTFGNSFAGPFGEYSYKGDVLSKTQTGSITANVDYQHNWADKPERSLVMSYQFSGTPSDTDVTNRFDHNGQTVPDDRRTDGFTNSMSHTVQADFSTPLGAKPGQTFNAGAKFIGRHNSSDQQNFIYDGSGYTYMPEGSVEYDFFNNIGALYAEYIGNFGPVGVKAGARYEHTWQNVAYAMDSDKDFSLDYGNLVPNASLQYNISMMQNIGLSYNMRISRPGITYLNPYMDNVTDPTVVTYGNPDLEAEIGHNINMVYNYFSQKWIATLTLRQTFVRNGMSQYSFYDDAHILNTTYGNIIGSSTTGLNAFIMWIPGQKTRVILNGGSSYTDIRSEELGQNNSGWTYNALLGLQQTLPWDLRLSVNGIASGRTITLQGWSSGMVIGTLGLTRSFMEDRLSLSLNGLTHLTGGRAMKIKVYSETEDFVNHSVTAIPLRMISLNLTFSFGKQDKVNMKKSRKTIEADSQLNSESMYESIGTMM